ncbi:MAG: L-seryl-tRNA(Sec) selenium transferase [Firmicutes bacterium]|nr:L-seryl-tRNA(Sec) selenium transferase [Bacillota bacterium]
MSLDYKQLRQKYLRLLPAVDKILQETELKGVEREIPRDLIVEAVQEVVAEKRAVIQRALTGRQLEGMTLSPAALALEARQKVDERSRANFQPVFNATGVLLHTNLGRAPLAAVAAAMLQRISSSFCNLELSLQTGRRAYRYEHVEELICRITGAEAALVVNNNAGAVFLALNTLAAGREVVVSRGELVEIGGSFRLPEVMTASGALLAEVGTTNKSYLRDYEGAINEKTALLLKVHSSNFKIMGFTSSVDAASLAGLGRKCCLPVMEDLGSGVLVDLTRYGLPYEPRVQDSIKAGVDVVTFSGDKLLGGPQSGLIIGKKKYLESIKSNQLTRALRVGKMTLAALESTLRLYLDEEKAFREIPVLRMLTVPSTVLKARAEVLAAKLAARLGPGWTIGISREKARVGGGSLPLAFLPSYQVTLERTGTSVNELVKKLRGTRYPVISRVLKNKILLDLRSLLEEADELLIETIVQTFPRSAEEETGGGFEP